ncbi:MAG: RNase adapter RapZ [Oscillospiraceae bacterium]|nr:RNase adapter RapZ [Oscillospiraceae bacterium]
MEFLIVSGLSGAGKSAVIKIIEDMGYYAVDNMPVTLIPAFAELYVKSSGQDKGPYERVALVTDVRAGQNFDALFASLSLIRAMNCDYRILYIESNPDVIILRYKETRRRHPLQRDGETLRQAIDRETALLASVREQADYIIDTSGLSASALRTHLEGTLTGADRRPMVVTVMSFGFKYGLPPESDLVFDVRFLPNPFHIAELRTLSGMDEPVREFVNRWPQTQDFLARLKDLTGFLLPQYVEEGKSGLVVSIGCTGGRHRSVTVAKTLYDDLRERGYYTVLTHRDIARDPAGQHGLMPQS